MRVVQAVVAVTAIALLLGVGALLGRHSAPDAGASGAHPVAAEEHGEHILYWTCSMHPQIKAPKSGQCPMCFMDLVPVRADASDSLAPNEMKLSARARVLARVETSPVERQLVTHEIRMVGKVAPDETRITYVSSYTSGRLDRLFVNYTGVQVRKGDHLAEIYSPDLLVAQTEYLSALQAIERTRAASGPAAESAQGMLQSAQRKLELWGIGQDQIDQLTRERRASDHMRIDSPSDGWVMDRQGYEGMYVQTGTRIFTVADLRSVWIMLDAYELDMGFIRLGQSVEFEVEAFPGQSFEARVSYIDPVLRPETRSVRVRLNVDNPGLKLRPEMFVRSRLKVQIGQDGHVVTTALEGKWLCYMHPEFVRDVPGKCDVCGMDLVRAESLGYAGKASSPPPALVVPASAVLLTGTRAVVYVEHMNKEEPSYEGRVVELGARAGDYYLVKSGLAEGERVATSGAILIDSAMQIMAKPSMMQPEEASGAQTRPATGTSPEPAETQAAHTKVASQYKAGAMYLEHARPVVDAYLELTDKLAADDVKAARTAVTSLRRALGGAVGHGLEGAAAEQFKQQMASIGKALPGDAEPSIGAMRAALPKLTEAVTFYLRSFGHDRKAAIAEAFCPMAFDNKGARWLQAGREIRNAYFGSQMLRCGEIKATILPDGSLGQ